MFKMKLIISLSTQLSSQGCWKAQITQLVWKVLWDGKMHHSNSCTILLFNIIPRSIKIESFILKESKGKRKPILDWPELHHGPSWGEDWEGNVPVWFFLPKVYFDPPLWTESGGCEDKGASLWLYNRSFVFAWRSKTIYFSINSFLQEYSEIRNVFSAASNCWGGEGNAISNPNNCPCGAEGTSRCFCQKCPIPIASQAKWGFGV